ncbi:MAG: acetyl-CoA carboxylase biotin carboxyl carrier protein subunit [Deltaproteobacteria bacterium]|nr:acetyl-CoA carboxylase biotin carboxyl carrier protein subunit [Deltaproteobacteria bacterium]MBW2255985.1 acetyl-CoA carboxylase biotin carboxyl carrier protein subunit [Deltaproteobacteria bacterium]
MAIEVYAPMVGKVVELLVKPGEKVEEDEPILLLEALKMKMPVVAPADGILDAYYVKPGEDVESDTVLAVIDDE